MVFTDARFDNSFMELNIVTKTIDLGDGRPVTIETGKLAKQAHGSVVVRQGDTMLVGPPPRSGPPPISELNAAAKAEKKKADAKAAAEKEPAADRADTDVKPVEA